MEPITILGWVAISGVVAYCFVNPKIRKKIIDAIREKIDYQLEISRIRRSAYKEERIKQAPSEGKIKARIDAVRQATGGSTRGLGSNIRKLQLGDAIKDKKKGKEPKSNIEKLMGV